jgi:GNAT superfamily N-acetyltransferase
MRTLGAAIAPAASQPAVIPVAVDVTFLRMDRRPLTAARPLPAQTRVEQVIRCSVGFYRYLYGTVGHDYVWWLRRTLTDAQLVQILRSPTVSVHVLGQDGEPAGFYELDRRPEIGTVNIAYFGLMPHAVGKGLGAAFLRHAVDAAWALGAAAVTVNTCTADHPRALPNYLAAGFVKLRTIRENWRVPARLGLPIPEHLRGA